MSERTWPSAAAGFVWPLIVLLLPEALEAQLVQLPNDPPAGPPCGVIFAPELRKALDDHEEGMRLWNDDECRWQSLRFALGDLDGDSQHDVALLAQTMTEGIQLVVLSAGGAWRVHEIDRAPLVRASTWSAVFFEVRPPGQFATSCWEPGDGPRRIELGTDSFMRSFEEKTATLFYVQRGELVGYPLSMC